CEHLRHLGRLTSAAFSPNSKYIVTGGGDDGKEKWQQKSSTVRIWDVKNGGKTLAVLTLNGNAHAAEFSPDGKLVLLAGSNCTAALWEWSERATPRIVQGDSCRQDSAPSPVSGPLRRLGYVSQAGDTHCESWWPPPADREVFAAAFSADGRLVATAGGDCKVRVWDVVSGQLKAELHGPTAAITRVVFSPDGQFLLSASATQGGWDTTARLWSMRPKEQETIQRTMRTLAGQDRPYGASFSADSQYVVTGDGSGMAWLWDTNPGTQRPEPKEPKKELRGHSHWVWSAAFSPLKGSGLLVTSGSNDGTARVWDLEGRDLFVLRGHSDFVGDAVFNPKGDQVLTASQDGTAIIWSVDLGKVVSRPSAGGLGSSGCHQATSPGKELTLTLNNLEVVVHDN